MACVCETHVADWTHNVFRAHNLGAIGVREVLVLSPCLTHPTEICLRRSGRIFLPARKTFTEKRSITRSNAMAGAMKPGRIALLGQP